MAYQPVENYGVIGDMHTVALVGMNGSIDWFCFPNFDSASVFAAILDDKKGGHFSITPLAREITYKQFYWPETNVLVTRFLSADGVGEITDYMSAPKSNKGIAHHHKLFRQVTAVRGGMAFRVECFPAFNYARDDHELNIGLEGAAFYSPGLSLGLSSSFLLEREGNGAVREFILEEGQSAIFILQEIEPGTGCEACLTEQEAFDIFVNTVEYWRNWLSNCTYRGRWREMVQRSALVLKLLTFYPTGAIVAAPTCSLPEEIGGVRNWDYRYTWIRDAAFTLYALLRIGLTDEAAQFMNWLESRCHELKPDGSLQIMYGIDGRHVLTEETLDNLEGYRCSSPVLIGNGAYDQLQIDIYGELMDSVYLYNKYRTPISYDLWTHLRRLVDWVCDNWQKKDSGIWEVRGGPQHFVYSKLMSWVAVDRGLRLADRRSFPADRTRWLKIRDGMYEEIMTQGWNLKRQAFVQHYGSSSLDAANLIMPLVFFLSPTDPRMIKTLDATMQSPERGGLFSNSLVYRYNLRESTDGLKGEEGTFNICTFWLVEALTRAGRTDRKSLDQARLIFEQMLGYANHLGLYAEETGVRGEALGNFPQAFTHLALISAAYNLNKALGE
jgi:GH15 family glucan-1,4-alpha-glucosidase